MIYHVIHYELLRNTYNSTGPLFLCPLGMWIMHCHFIFHTETGMNTVFQVGERSDFVKTPPNFPTCNSYLPPVDPTEFQKIDWDDEPTEQEIPPAGAETTGKPS